ncbi:LINE-1 type transposase domain-containing 1 [Labeo rohita]|uniref:LINE-1 type transposase domain-containing 1 n=1 Tax=Labeo rohita TaxID=84645 RepID=A0A498P6S9_LABRO|nr:LINE-1 type transposase domain-containing 1 [Labeo rohita]
MEGEKHKKGKGKLFGKVEKSDKVAIECLAVEEQGECDGGRGENVKPTAAGMEDSISVIRADIKLMAMSMKSDLNNFRDDLKKELTDISQEIYQKLSEITTDLKATNDRVSEVETRITETEEWSADFREALDQSLQAQEKLQTKLTDLEARSRRNNLRIYGIAEGAENNDIFQFIESFLKDELDLVGITPDLGIQRCHRALGPRPPSEAQPRSVIVYFQEFKVKEMVLRAAWKKREIFHRDRRIYFDHDYPAETLAKRKAYTQIRRILKGKGIRFQTPPPAKLRVFFESGPVTYESADEAAEDLKKRGFQIDHGKTAEAEALEKIMPNVDMLFNQRQKRNIDPVYIKAAVQGFTNTLLAISINAEGGDATNIPVDVGIVIEGVEVLQDLGDIASACALLMGVIYAMNLSYPQELKTFFEVLQKIFFQLDATRLSTKSCFLLREVITPFDVG